MQIDQTLVTAKTYLNSGRQLRKEGKLDPAIEQFQQALKLAPNLVPALAQLAKIYESRKELDSAINYLQQLVHLKPNNQNFFDQLITIYSNKLAKNNNMDEVIKTYQKVTQIAQEKQVEKVHKEFGDILFKLSIRQGEVEQAITFFKETINSQPNSPWSQYNLGMVFVNQERLNEAENCYRKAIKIQPDFYQAYAELGECLRKKGDKKAAFKYTMKAFEINPNLNRKYQRNLNVKSPKKQESYRNIFQESFDQENFEASSRQYYTFSRNLFQQGKVSEAISYCQKYLYYKLKKSNPEFVSQYWDNGALQKPNFLIIGVGKCGTTALYGYLGQHPQFLQAIVKEPQYLGMLAYKIEKIDKQGDWSVLNKEKDFYLGHFPPRPEGSQFITGEASTTTIWSKSENIVKNWFPHIKLIVILRNPIKRAISHYNFSIKNRKNSLTSTLYSELQEIEQMKNIAQQIESLQYVDWKHHLTPGLYLYYLKRWMKLFPREQFLILTNEDLAQDPAGVMKQTFDFLGLPEYDGINYTPRNVGSYPKDIDPDLLSRLQDFYRPHNQRLEEFLGRKFNWD